jgi:hypothetical protein
MVVAAGIKFPDGSYMVANTDDPFGPMYATRQGTVETVGTPTGLYRRDKYRDRVTVPALEGAWARFRSSNLTYLALQPAIEVGGTNTDDCSCQRNGDESLLQLMFNQARVLQTMMDYSALTSLQLRHWLRLPLLSTRLLQTDDEKTKNPTIAHNGYLREEMHECHERIDEIECNYKDEFGKFDMTCMV